MLRLILLFILFWMLYKIVKPLIIGFFTPNEQVKTKRNKSGAKESFQEKNKGKIEDADFEELD